jgi:hypothetical protein
MDSVASLSTTYFQTRFGMSPDKPDVSDRAIRPNTGDGYFFTPLGANLVTKKS